MTNVATRKRTPRTISNALAPYWRATLVIVGVVALILAVLLEAVILTTKTTTKVTGTAPDLTTKVSNPPDTALVTALLGAGIVCLVAAAFWARITKITFAGMEIDLAALDAKAEAAAKGNSKKKHEILGAATEYLVRNDLYLHRSELPSRQNSPLPHNAELFVRPAYAGPSDLIAEAIAHGVAAAEGH